MLTYKYGSRSLQHEGNTTLNELSWIGPRSNDILGAYGRDWPSAKPNQVCVSDHDYFNDEQSGWDNSNTRPSPINLKGLNSIDVTMPLKVVDRRLAVRLISAAVVKHEQCIESADIIHELQIMLLLNMKAEIQAVDDAGDLTTWLESSLKKRIEGI